MVLAPIDTLRKSFTIDSNSRTATTVMVLAAAAEDGDGNNDNKGALYVFIGATATVNSLKNCRFPGYYSFFIV